MKKKLELAGPEYGQYRKDSIKTRKVAILGADGFDDAAVAAMKKALIDAGAQAKFVAPRLGVLKSAKGAEAKVDFSLLTASSVMFDAVYVPEAKSPLRRFKSTPRRWSLCRRPTNTVRPSLPMAPELS